MNEKHGTNTHPNFSPMIIIATATRASRAISTTCHASYLDLQARPTALLDYLCGMAGGNAQKQYIRDIAELAYELWRLCSSKTQKWYDKLNLKRITDLHHCTATFTHLRPANRSQQHFAYWSLFSLLGLQEVQDLAVELDRRIPNAGIQPESLTEMLGGEGRLSCCVLAERCRC